MRYCALTKLMAHHRTGKTSAIATALSQLRRHENPKYVYIKCEYIVEYIEINI